MVTCDEVREGSLLLRREEGFEAPGIEEHLVECAACAGRASALAGETAVLEAALASRLDRLRVGPPPAPRHLRLWPAFAAAAALLLMIGAGRFLFAPAGPAAEEVLEIPMAPAVAPGCIAPPCVAQLLLAAGAVVEVEVLEAAEEGRRIEGRVLAALLGERESLPARIRLRAAPGVSELGAREAWARAGESILLVLVGTGADLRLTSGDAHSVLGTGRLLYLPTASFRPGDFAALRTAVARALALRRTVEGRPWAEQGGALSAALAGGCVLTRELAFDWYSWGRRGYPSDDICFVAAREKPGPPLPDIEATLLALAVPRAGELGTVSGHARDLLALDEYAGVLSLLAHPAGDLGSIWEACAGMAGWMEEGPARTRFLEALRRTPDGEVAGAYLRAALLFRFGDPSRLRVILDARPTEEDRARLEHAAPPLWPPLRLLGELAGREFPDRDHAETWIGAQHPTGD